MALDTYSNLQTAIAAWAFRTGDDEFTAQLPDFITMTENRVNRTLRIREMEASATITLTDGAGTLPADYLEHRRVVANVSPISVLEMVTPDYASDRYPENGAAYPRYFSIIGNALKTYPTSTGDIALTYYQKVPALSEADPTNWLLAKAPEVYLYGALVEAAPYMQDDQAAQRYITLFQKALKDLQDADIGARYARATARTSGPTP
jgi:hypothetical protein